MIRLLGVLAVLAICIIGIGFYRDWFVLSGKKADVGNKVKVGLTVDPDKAKEDVKSVKEGVKDLGK